jgi:hypothetical protein
MRILAFSALALGLGLLGAQLTACSNSSDDCNATATCGTAASSNAGKPGAGAASDAGSNAGGTPSGGGAPNTSGTTGAGGEAGGPGSECMGGVADDPTCWASNELGVFVSSDAGDDTNGNGTKEAPFASISKGIEASAGKNVYVCLGDADFYEEKLTITELSGDGVRIYGGFECAGWTYSKTRYAGVSSPEPTALRISGLKKGATIENLRFVAANGTEADPSSYGAFITDSNQVVLRRVELTAGAGMKGKDGDAGAKGENGSAAGAPPVGSDGCAVTAAAGEWTIESSCGSQGGAGAKGAKSVVNGASGFAGIPAEHVHPLSDINNGGPGEDGIVASFDGKIGTQGDAGAVGAKALEKGTFSAAGYQGADGEMGTNGYPGQGGGGGGASKGTAVCFGASGGAGGMGGCGGLAGLGGLGGGASVGLLSWNSEVLLQSSKLRSGSGGAGGAGGKGGGGGAGADGGAAGAEDAASGVRKGGRGGSGGTGGNGGSGSGGTGGPSYAIAYSGTKPSYSEPDTILTAGAGGEPGIGGQVLDAKAPDGFAGDAAAEFQIP